MSNCVSNLYETITREAKDSLPCQPLPSNSSTASSPSETSSEELLKNPINSRALKNLCKKSKNQPLCKPDNKTPRTSHAQEDDQEAAEVPVQGHGGESRGFWLDLRIEHDSKGAPTGLRGLSTLRSWSSNQTPKSNHLKESSTRLSLMEPWRRPD